MLAAKPTKAIAAEAGSILHMLSTAGDGKQISSEVKEIYGEWKKVEAPGQKSK